MKYEDEINQMFFDENSPIDLIEPFPIERLDVKKLIQFFKKEKNNLSLYESDNHYTPLEIFGMIRQRIQEKHLCLHDKHEKSNSLKQILEKDYKSKENKKDYLTFINGQLLDKITKSEEIWEKSISQKAVNMYHTLILYTYASDFYIRKHPKNYFPEPDR